MNSILKNTFKRAISLFFLLMAFSATAQNAEFTNAADYNNYIVGEQSKVVQAIIDYNLSITHINNTADHTSKREDILSYLKIGSDKLSALGSFKGDDKLKNEAIEVFRLYIEVYDIGFSEINELRKNRDSSYETMATYIHAQEKAEEKLKQVGDRFMKAQKEFAKKHKLTIKESDLKNHMEIIAKVNQYSRNIYLEYFRVAKVDDIFLRVLNEQKPDQLEEIRKRILTEASLTLTNLPNIPAVNNDDAYRKKSIELVSYYKQLAENEYQDLIAILHKTNITQADVDRYNDIVTRVNEKSQKLIEELNHENREMLKRNIPLY